MVISAHGKCLLFAFRAITEGPGEETITVHLFINGQRSVAAANVFINYKANGAFTTVWTSLVLRELSNSA